MIRKVVSRHRLGDPAARRADREYWLSRPPAERVAAVEFLRSQFYGSAVRRPLQRVLRVIRRKGR